MLSGEQKRFFDENGYLVVEDVLDQRAALDPVRKDYRALMNALYTGWYEKGLLTEPAEALDFFGQIKAATRAKLDWFQPLDISLPGSRIGVDTPMHASQPVLDMLTDDALLDVVESLIGPEITSVPIQHVRIKPPADDLQGGESLAHVTPTAWHQDRGVGHQDADATEMVTVWIAVTDADESNACLTVMPMDHHDGMKPHCPQIQTAIAPGFLDEGAAISLPVRSGGVVLLHPLTPHASLPNGKEKFRWSFDVRYAVTGQPTGRAHFPDFVARSRARPETELRDAERWRAMWDEARAACAVRDHIPIHRWSADAPVCA